MYEPQRRQHEAKEEKRQWAEAKRGDEDFDRTSQTSRSWLLVISLVGLVVILAAAKLMARDISRAMRTAVADLKTGAQQVAARSEEHTSELQSH